MNNPSNLLREYVDRFLDAGEINELRIRQHLIETTEVGAEHKSFIGTGRFSITLEIEASDG